MRIFIVLAFILLTGCTRQYFLQDMYIKKQIDYVPVTSSEYDYLVKINRFSNIDYSSDNSEGRMEVIRYLLGTTCQNPEIVGSDYIRRGTTVIGVETGEYQIKVRCKK